ncbi:hypothetical protein, partial [Idiomarina sp.]|uniref:hypothetical protein n=1 Tax=Idiomarina sp. TaxID=1874361 RepID=UPI00351958EA
RRRLNGASSASACGGARLQIEGPQPIGWGFFMPARRRTSRPHLVRRASCATIDTAPCAQGARYDGDNDRAT